MARPKAITGQIDVTKITKDRLYQGQKGTYLKFYIPIKPETDQYGNDGMITESTSAEERALGTQGAILGNAKLWFFDDEPERTQPLKQKQKPLTLDDDDLPF